MNCITNIFLVMEADWDMNTRKYSTLSTHNRTSVCGWNRIDSQCYPTEFFREFHEKDGGDYKLFLRPNGCSIQAIQIVKCTCCLLLYFSAANRKHYELKKVVNEKLCGHWLLPQPHNDVCCAFYVLWWCWYCTLGHFIN